MRENAYQAGLIERLHAIFEGCFIMKNDTHSRQGVPDLLILYKDRWAMLEVKKSEDAAIQPNQDYYVDLFDGMSFAAYIYPENEEDVLDELQHAFKVRRTTRLLKS